MADQVYAREDPQIGELKFGEQDKQLYDKLLISHDDIAFARFCAGVLLRKGWHGEPWERRGTVYERQTAYTTALVVSYACAFTKNKGWPRFPSKLLNYDDKEKALREQLLKLRNEVFAHSDGTRNTIRNLYMEATPLTAIRRPSLQISADDTTLFLTMSEKLLSSINQRMESMRVNADVGIAEPPGALIGSTGANIKFHRRRK